MPLPVFATAKKMLRPRRKNEKQFVLLRLQEHKWRQHGIGVGPGGVVVKRKPLSEKEQLEVERYRYEPADNREGGVE